MCPAKGVNPIVVPAGGKVFEHAQKFIVPLGADNFDVARFRLARKLVLP